MNIYKFEFSQLKNSTIIWSLSVPLGLAFYMLFFPMIASDTGALESIMASFPEEFLAIFGMNADLPISSLLGYFSLTVSMIYIPLAIQASNYGFHILSVEEREFTADFLLTKPINRLKIFISKIGAALTSLLITNICMWIATISILYIVKGDETFELSKVILILTSFAFLQLVFFSLSLLISVSVKKVSSVLSYSMGLGFGLYIISALGSMLSFSFFNILSPYAHFEPNYILVNSNHHWGYVLITIAMIIISIPMSYFLYNKRNISSL
ncbi:MAG: ABC transporter permease [Acholeplasmataceae bacterium]|nr:ABC transporter permease [Acholeplasmataceae bacterium]